ncbi:cell division protein FtsL [Brucepastera parasyntrophica]|uniref:cell division protein FtsL n=1 Tax=Brucepastera parasyntrophica TaxID=2880008 RepID=UPI002109B0E4|nr:cell division protein FtsL [Brucepastera parasyntrophica]ULQ60173.1 cell division protein FtsL [Brucepastera parasyntrophica]
MIKNIATLLIVISIPAVLFAGILQTGRYGALESEVRQLNTEQHEVIAENKKLISGITVLSTPERIEKIAVEDLAMRKAKPEEIMRIELKRGELGG